MTRIGPLALAMCVLALPAAAQPVAGDPRFAATETLLSQLQPGATLGAFTERLRQEFRNLDADADGVLTTADAALHESIAMAQLSSMAGMQILRADLDHDGVVTADEVRRMFVYERRTQTGPSAAEAIENDVRRVMAADKDGDGKITLAEATDATQLQSANRAVAASSLGPKVRQLLTLSRSGDGRLTLADFEAAGAEQFRAVDADGNGTVSSEELNGFRQRQTEQARRSADAAREAQERAACAMPKASDAAKVVVLSAHRSEAISRVALGSQDVMTGTGEIRIEPGAEPLYLVVISHEPTIWRLTGAVERVERLIGAGMTPTDSHTSLNSTRGTISMTPPRSTPNNAKPVPLIGITGVPADRVSFLARPGCLKPFAENVSADGIFSVGAVRRDSGKDPDVVAGRYNVGTFLLPSGQIRSAYEDKNQPRLTIVKDYGVLTLKGDTSGVAVRTGPVDVETDLAQSSPGGVVDLDEKAVVASAPAVRYDVLPGLAGLLQLQNSGALTRNRRGEFIIHRQIRFPAGLTAHPVTFVLLRGVPVPDGNPEGATVISEDTGLQLKLERR